MAELRVTVNKAKCQAYAKCQSIAPAVFALGEDGKVQVLDAAGAPAEAVVKAARGCPYRVITVEEVGGPRLFPPERK
jgi:ferredoxin